MKGRHLKEPTLRATDSSGLLGVGEFDPPPTHHWLSNTNCLSALKSYAPSNTKQTGQVVVYSVHMCNNSKKKKKSPGFQRD